MHTCSFTTTPSRQASLAFMNCILRSLIQTSCNLQSGGPAPAVRHRAVNARRRWPYFLSAMLLSALVPEHNSASPSARHSSKWKCDSSRVGGAEVKSCGGGSPPQIDDSSRDSSWCAEGWQQLLSQLQYFGSEDLGRK